VPKATAIIKFRYSAKVDPRPVVDMVRAAAQRELAHMHPFVQLCSQVAGAAAGVAPYGTDASELQALAPCVILGPGDIAQAHAPDECVPIADLAAAVPLFVQLAQEI
jgi:acetylornithine deacetylase